MAKPGSRPISPHLTHYKWGPAMAASIMHRVTGDGLAIVGTLVMLWWLGALASGPQAYASFLVCMNGWVGRVILIGLSWAVISHAISGIRHLVLDTGAGFELKTNRMWATIVLILPIFLTAALWLFILGKGLN